MNWNTYDRSYYDEIIVEENLNRLLESNDVCAFFAWHAYIPIYMPIFTAQQSTNMEEKHNFTEVPYDYQLCLKRDCPKASTCLRQLVEREMPDNIEFWSVISPKFQAARKGDCPHYRSNEKIFYAKGFVSVLDNLPYKQMRKVIPHLVAHFGQRTYYRVRKGERLLSPAEQRDVLDIFRRCGVAEPPRFDAYIEGYAW